jgi:hypothetical protein
MLLGGMGQEEIMKLLRSITRRGFNVGTAGWFTVLKPNTWFPASRLPGRFRYRSSQSAETTAVDHADSRQMTNSPQIMIPTTKDLRLMRPALIILTAMMVTSGLLWWIMHP